VLSPVQLFFGHLMHLNVLKQRNNLPARCPRLGSFIASGNWTAREIGLEAFPPKA
jgi:hypothetical protein